MKEQTEHSPEAPRPVRPRAEGKATLTRAIYLLFIIPLPAASLLFRFFPEMSTTVLVALTAMTTLIFTTLAAGYLALRYRSLAAEWDEETFTLYQDHGHSVTERWDNLKKVRWVAPFSLGLTFDRRREWVIPREWFHPYDASQFRLRQVLIRSHPDALTALEAPTPNLTDPRSPTDGYTLVATWAVVVVILLLLAILKVPLWFALPATLAVVAAGVGWSSSAFRRWLRRKVLAPKISMSDDGFQLPGRSINWSQVTEMDWFGPGHLILRLRVGRRSTQVDLADLSEGQAMKAAVMAQPRSIVLQEEQTQLKQDIWLLAPSGRHVAALASQIFFVVLFLTMISFLMRGTLSGFPVWFAVVGSIYFSSTWWLTSRPVRITSEGIWTFPPHRHVRFEDVRTVRVNPDTGELTVWAGSGTVVFPGDWPVVGRVMAILRARVSPDAFEEGGEFQVKGSE